MKASEKEVAEVLSAVAPEIDADGLDRDAEIMTAIDIDSMDFLEFIVGLSKRYQVEIPEADYPQLSTIAGAVSYLNARL